jgi:acetyl-CoA C-acetyltransferase
MQMNISEDDVVIVAAKRTAIGAVNGMFRGVPAYELGEAVIRALLKYTGVQGHEVSEIVLGQIMNSGAARPRRARRRCARASPGKWSPGGSISSAARACAAYALGFRPSVRATRISSSPVARRT